MKIVIFCILAVSSVVFCPLIQAADSKYIIRSVPEKATIYTNGICTFEEIIANENNNKIAVELPPETIVNSVKIYRGMNQVSNIILTPGIQEFTKQIVEKNVSTERVVESTQTKIFRYLLQFEEKERTSNQPLKLEYSVKGISWQPSLRANVDDNTKVNLCLDAKIINTVLPLDSATITLVATPQGKNFAQDSKIRNHRDRDQLIEEYSPWEKDKYQSSLYAQYPIGNMSIPSGNEEYFLTTIACKETKIEDVIYMWKTKEKRVEKYVYSLNPFHFPICDALFTVSKNNIKLFQKNIQWTENNEPVLLLENNEPGISCSSSIEVVEDFEKRNIWSNCSSSRTPPCDVKDALFYNHQYEFTCGNRTGNDVKLEVVFEKKYGQNYKNIYNFRTPPTKSPGSWHIWDLILKNKEDKTIKFHIDSDKKTYKEYKKYNKAIEGC